MDFSQALLRRCCGLAVAALLAACGGGGSADTSEATANRYATTTFVASDAAAYAPTVGTVPALIDAWGIAIRPAGIPGHFWVLAGDKSYEYVGDVTGKTTPPCAAAGALCADLAPLVDNTVTLPDFPVDSATGRPDITNAHATGVVFNPNAASFVITQTPVAPSADRSPVTAGAKFLFTTSFGAVYAWTERKHADGSFDRADTAVKVFDSRDDPNDCGQFYGMALNPGSSRLYVADFGTDTDLCSSAAARANVGRSFRVRVFDGALQANGRLREITTTLAGGAAFVNPFAKNPAGIVAGDFVPWNVQLIGQSLFVAYAQVQQDPRAAVGTPWPANEVHAAGAGRIAEFDLDGWLIAVWDDRGLLDAPWGLALAPANFGALSGTLLVGNFGDDDSGSPRGALTAFDTGARRAVNYVRDAAGAPLQVPGVWGLVFGNGDTLGDTNALYYAAGPNGEADGSFGVVRPLGP